MNLVLDLEWVTILQVGPYIFVIEDQMNFTVVAHLFLSFRQSSWKQMLIVSQVLLTLHFLALLGEEIISSALAARAIVLRLTLLNIGADF